jgi:hypothetical protein
VILLQSYFYLFVLVCLVLASKKLHAYVSVQGWKMNLPQVALSIELLIELLRLAYYVDPQFQWAIYSTVVSNWLVSAPWTLIIVTTFLVAAFWYELLHKVVRQSSSTGWLSVRQQTESVSHSLTYHLFLFFIAAAHEMAVCYRCLSAGDRPDSDIGVDRPLFRHAAGSDCHSRLRPCGQRHMYLLLSR